jgi:hypothetical protein
LNVDVEIQHYRRDSGGDYHRKQGRSGASAAQNSRAQQHAQKH